MASQNSSSFSGSRSISEVPQVKCYHDEVAPLRIVKYHGPTEGKRFYGCSHWPRTCGFFRWADEVDEVNDLQLMVYERDTTIAELEYEKGLLEESVTKLKEDKSKLEEDVTKLAMENAFNFEAMASTKADKKLFYALLFSWIFFAVVLLSK